MWTMTLTYPDQSRETLESWEDALQHYDAFAARRPGRDSSLTLHFEGPSSLATMIAACQRGARSVTNLAPSDIMIIRDDYREHVLSDLIA